MNNIWIEKYRPKNINEIIGQKPITDTINNFIINKHFPNLLLVGQQSLGKTTLALCIVKQFNIFYLELNASNDRGIDTVKETIYKFVLSNYYKQKIIILDEIDSMTIESQLLLVTIIDNYSKHCRFILICNYINKLSPMLLSRCCIFMFNKINEQYLINSINNLEKSESFKIENKKEFISLFDYDIRKIFNSIQLLKYYETNNIISSDITRQYLNIPIKKEIIRSLENKNIENEYNITHLFEYFLEKKDYKNIILLAEIELNGNKNNKIDNLYLISNLK